VPTRREIAGLSHKVDMLTRQVQMLVSRLPGSRPEGVVTYYVMASEEGWIVGEEGLAEALKEFPNKEQALDHARELAHASTPSRLHVYRKDGSIQDTFGYEI
jgi:hypothetical protein